MRGEMRNEYKFLVRKPGGKRLLGKFRFMWEDMHLIEIGWEDVKWIHLAQNRVQWRAVVKANEPSGTKKAGTERLSYFFTHLAGAYRLVM
jgi:hypothetical protein